jgi:hypothetical protein
MPAGTNNFIPGVTGWTGMTFMPNTTSHAAAANTLTGSIIPESNMIRQTTTANNVGGQVPVPATNTQSGTAPPQLRDPSLGSNPGAANSGAGFSPVVTATPYGTNNIPQFLNQGLQQLNSNFSNQNQWFDLIGKILGQFGGGQQQQSDPAADLLKTRIMAEASSGGPAGSEAWRLRQLSQNPENRGGPSGAFSWGQSPARQMQDQSMFYQSLAHDTTPKSVAWNAGNNAGTYRPPSGASGWGPSMPSY